jgi:hypothetical protein
MQIRDVRYVVLIGLFLLGGGLFALIAEPQGKDVSRWPSTDATFTVADQWSPDAEHMEQINGATYVTRALTGPDQSSATLTIVTNQSAKLFGPGADVPFQGSGYSLSPVPTELLPLTPGIQGMVASRGAEQWLVYYAYGERRGLIGNGPLGWGMAVLDGVLGRPNDYYRLFVVGRVAALDAASSGPMLNLASTVLPRIAAWYGNG